MGWRSVFETAVGFQLTGLSLIEDMKASGFDIVSTANNHALDRGAIGVEQTITNLEKAGLLFTGTRRSGQRPPWSTLTHVRGFNIAWSHGLMGTNGIPCRTAWTGFSSFSAAG